MKLKRFIGTLTAIAATMLLSTSVSAAITVPGPEEEKGTVTPSPGDNSDTDVEIDYQHPAYTVYTPKVTMLHNVNAMLAENGYSVYYMPTLSDLPVNLADYVTDLTVGSEKHEFALVYDGYFDTEAQLQSPTSVSSDVVSANTSKTVYSAEDSSRALNTIGYDLLLSNEDFLMSVKDGNINIDYIPYKVSSSNLTTETCVMDLYKAVGVFEYNFTFAFGVDKDFDANKSPILQELSVLTSQSKSDGLDISEAKTYVAVSRTKPELYWERCQRDGIFSGGLQYSGVSDYIGNDCSVSEIYNRNDNLTLGEFCCLARAIMNLYGEPVITETERQAFYQAYGVDYQASTFSSDEIYESVMYLSAKGIIEPSGLDFNKPVTYQDIDPILGRIADEDARLTIKNSAVINNTLTAAGYSPATVSITDEVSYYSVTDYADKDFYDFYIEFCDATTYKVYSKPTDNSAKSSAGAITATVSNSGTSTENNVALASTANLKLLVDGKVVDNASNYYRFLGIEEKTYTVWDDTTESFQEVTKYYYHFKVNVLSGKFKNVTLHYATDTTTETAVGTFKDFTLPNTDGGIYDYEDGSFVYHKFSDIGYDTSYIDKESHNNIYGKMSANSCIISMHIENTTLNKGTLQAYSVDGINWMALLDNNGSPKYNVAIDVASDIRAFLFSGTSVGSDSSRLEIVTSNTDKVKNSKFYKNTTVKTSAPGYYRSSDGSLLVSYRYLEKLGLVTGIQELDTGKGYMITVESSSSTTISGMNVVLMTSSETNYVIVGDTIFPNKDGETLVEAYGDDYYINYRACLGWTGRYAVVSVGDGQVFALTLSDFNSSTIFHVNNSVKQVTTFYPNATTGVMFTNVSTSQAIDYSKEYYGMNLSGSYGLSPYIVVMADEQGKDYLFVWHRNDVVTEDGDVVNVDSAEDDSAREKFRQLTNITVPKKIDYSLKMFALYRDGTNPVDGFKFSKISYSNHTYGNIQCTLGWIYSPRLFSSVKDAINTYAECSTKLAIPIFECNGTLYDANVNMCSDGVGNPLCKVGIMPASMLGKDASLLASFSDNNGAAYTTAKPTELGYGDAVQEYQIYTAPVAMFAQLKGLGTKEAKSVNNGVIYFGTSRCVAKGSTITISSHRTSMDSSTSAVLTYKGVGSNCIYAITTDSTMIGEILESVESAISSWVEDPKNKVDWDAYKFSTLSANIDAWTTVLLIFILNILPRVCSLLMLILMALACIKNVPFWRKFCQKHFDIYSFLTLGHQSVDTINTHRIFFTSMICSGLFIIIMDGHLFNLMILISELFIELYQH